MTYIDYQKLLFEYNFIGGAGQNLLPYVTGDERTQVDQDNNNYYNIDYKILGNKSDLDTLGYYSLSDREYTAIPQVAGVDNPGVINQVQLDIISSVMSNSGYGGSFAHVAKINFNEDTSTNIDDANIVIGTTTSGEPANQSEYFSGQAYARDYSTGDSELEHGDIWLNEDSTHIWDSSEIGSAGYAAIMQEFAHSLGVDLYRPENRVASGPEYDPVSFGNVKSKLSWIDVEPVGLTFANPDIKDPAQYLSKSSFIRR